MTIESVIPDTGESINDNSMANRFRKKAHAMVDKTADRAEQVEASAEQRAGAASEAFADKKDMLEDQMKTQYKAVREKAKENPLLTLGIAFAAGALLGKALSR